MAVYRYRYESATYFSQQVSSHSFLLRAIPINDNVQKLTQSSLEILPNPKSVSTGTDAWGTRIDYGFLEQPHNMFKYISSGIVEVIGGVRLQQSPSPVFMVHSGLADFSSEMKEWMSPSEDSLMFAYETAKTICDNMTYSPGSTEITTKGSCAFHQKKGVCQDFSHILIALCRERKIPARYVCGFVLGEGETHAWTEIWHNGAWYGVDPTSGKACDDRYIAVGFGRDASDTSVSRGVFVGSAFQSSITNVIVEKI